MTMKQTRNYASLFKWATQTVLPLAALVAAAAVLIHYRFGIKVTEVVLAGITVFVIQTATVIPMFWAVRYWRKSGDSRPGIALSGLYGLLIVVTGSHYAVKWRLVGPQDTLSEAVMIIVITGTLMGVISLRRSRARRRELSRPSS